eukprot:CAMPEP_0115277602 /NCGR_PEP_ID=MMETSP0270-20121206/57326_1 /TAXON_ID=71861 /ORGANISM="Scrippsiella trochoidea, Strain CCMP3099" /LENGTH=162 /DNA_ID=CAMNT_0002694251 /DNA_START=246 /DNA_END=734 /DNA_ORIENTATION=+
MCAAAPPAPPKKNLNGFMFFCNDRRPKLMKEQPDVPVTQIGKLLGEEWRTFSDKAKKPYQTKAEKDKTRYTKELAKYVKEYGEPPAKRTRKSKKEDGEPKKKRLPSAYNMFVKEQMPIVKEKTGAATAAGAMGELSKQWKALTAKKKEKYTKMAAEAAVESD